MMTDVVARLRTQAEPITLDELFAEALSFGRVSLHTSDKREFWATIDFETIAGISLKAGHPGYQATPAEALRKAIENAREIRGAFK